MRLLASTALAIVIMFLLPALVAAIISSDWNARRLRRARRYRAIHGTPWWVVEPDSAQRQRKWLEREKDRVEAMQ